jgi:hypothetical protein
MPKQYCVDPRFLSRARVDEVSRFSISVAAGAFNLMLRQTGCEDDTRDGGDGGGPAASGTAMQSGSIHLDVNESSWDRIVRTGDT